MDAVRACIENALEGEQVHIVMNANCPKTSDESMSEDKVDWKWYEITTCENRQGLKESINGMKGKS